MQTTLYINQVEQAQQLLKPRRMAILQALGDPRTCNQLAEQFGQTPQQIYYHVKALERAGLVTKVREERVRGINEGYYQAKAQSIWLSPELVQLVGGQRQARDQLSLRYLMALAQEIYADVGRLGANSAQGDSVPSLSLSGNIYLPDATRRAEFKQEVQHIFQQLATKYGLDDAGEQSGTFKLALACYPSK